MPGTSPASPVMQATEAHLPFGGFSGSCNTAEALCEPLLRSVPGLPLDPMACP
jgi:hypothetical protein